MAEITDKQMTFDPTKPVQTRDGRAARILCVDRKSADYPIVALVSVGASAAESIHRFGADGRAPYHSRGSDLVNIPQRHERWIVVGHGGDSVVLHRSEADARSSAYMRGGKPKYQVLRIEWEGEA